MVNRCRQLVVSEFRPSKLCLYYNDWRAFTYSAWLPEKWQFQWIFLAYRWVIAAYFFAWLFPSGLDSANGGVKYFIYLTNWAQLAWTTYLIVAALSVTMKFSQVHILHRERSEHDLQDEAKFFDVSRGCCGIDSNGTTWYQKIHWLLFTIGAESAFAVSILYWAVIYDGEKLNGVNLNTHLINGIVSITVLWVSRTPVRLLHVVYLVGFGTVYSVFTGIYYAAGGTNAQDESYIYEVLDYDDNPGTATAYVLIVVLVFLPFIHLLFYVQYVARYWLSYALFHGLRRREHAPLDSESGGGAEQTEEDETKSL